MARSATCPFGTTSGCQWRGGPAEAAAWFGLRNGGPSHGQVAGGAVVALLYAREAEATPAWTGRSWSHAGIEPLPFPAIPEVVRVAIMICAMVAKEIGYRAIAHASGWM
jgi:hypothetical protein